MSGVSRKSVVLASILKPVDDTRMYEKFGLSLSQTNKYDINIIGFQSKNTPQAENIKFHPIYNFRRLSISRFTAPLKFFFLLLKIRPAFIIIHTHELLGMAALYRIFSGAPIFYDIQENFSKNVMDNYHYSLPSRIVSRLIKLRETFFSMFVRHCFLSDDSYYKELSFTVNKERRFRPSDRSTILRNKFKKLPVPPRETIPGMFIYSGTISESYGVYESIELISQFHQIDPSIRLTIIGYCAHPPTLEKVKALIRDKPFIELIGGVELVPHPQILEKIQEASYALVPHQLTESIKTCFPSKMYEYLYYQKPMLMRNHEPWVSYASRYQAVIPIDFSENPTELLDKLKSSAFYPQGVDDDIFWKVEEKKLLQFLEKENLL